MNDSILPEKRKDQIRRMSVKQLRKGLLHAESEMIRMKAEVNEKEQKIHSLRYYRAFS